MSGTNVTINREFIRIKGEVARARKSKNAERVIEVINKAEETFMTHDWFPDVWSHWESLRDDARMSKIYGTPYMG
jgi:hypothetical protein